MKMKAEYTKPEFSEFFFFSHITLSFFQLLPFIKVLRRQQKKTEQMPLQSREENPVCLLEMHKM